MDVLSLYHSWKPVLRLYVEKIDPDLAEIHVDGRRVTPCEFLDLVAELKSTARIVVTVMTKKDLTGGPPSV
ncbi:MAG: hypothetical protein A3G34_15215 [Candidatus Lindowbacteria bacterium RIFCSPLOWO2_12_FULL_62_27]|nr:MAG: hypothetical protein A3G34_15215 [Candidatus Lindowbacteria bacterium RIFCSPLOWO2_12_FULL_62_27]OGH63874.1 MAG: hypothetical protein A3I06_06195 [Candidatus Lindowbacteria bacterium RIFCSPLOWO2_02_FULL_62_12]